MGYPITVVICSPEKNQEIKITVTRSILIVITTNVLRMYEINNFVNVKKGRKIAENGYFLF